MSSRIARRAVTALIATLVFAGGIVFVAAAPAQADVLTTEIHDGQAFAVQRSPAYPTCSSSGGTFSSFALTQFQRPYSTPAGRNPGDMGTDYLKLLASNDSNHPWRLGRFNAAGEELHYKSGTSSWVGPSDPGYAGYPPWDTAGVVMALYDDGYFYESYPNLYGLFISLSTTYSLGGSHTYTPTSVYNDCVNFSNYGEVAMAKSAAIDPNNGGGGASPAVDVVVSGAVGDKLEGQTATITGSDLKATSPFDLTMHSDPVVLKQGTTDGSGAFSETVILPTEVCGQSGVHELVLTGTDANDAAVTDSVWVELATDCTIMQIGDAALTASMPNTGVSARNGIIVSTSGVILFLLALFVYRSRRGLRFAAINANVADMMLRLNSSLGRMERQAQRSATRRRLRK